MTGGYKETAKRLSAVLFYTAAALYPVLIFYFLAVRKAPLRSFSVFVIVFAVLIFILGTGRGKAKGKTFLQSSLLLLCLGVICLITNSPVVLKFYPVLMNVIFLAAFASTFFSAPNMIFRFATLADKTIKGSMTEKRVEAYCRKVTIAWCCFFVLNGSIASFTVFSGSDIMWTAYNGAVSYILTGLIFTVEFIIRKNVQKKMPRAIALSAFKNNSRPLSAVMCYEDAWEKSRHKTWGDFLEGTAILRRKINSVDSGRWLLYCDDCWLFLLAFTALLQCKKEILLSANISPSYAAEIRAACGDESKCAPFLTDINFEKFPARGEKPDNTFDINDLLVSDIEPRRLLPEDVPAINADETSIIMYTSGSTGKPKAVKQRLTEFENDNRFALSMWGEEFLKRKLCSTVNQHHIYGLLYSILLPFTAAVPFRRNRIEFPDEFEKLTGAQYMIITVPAFLKRIVEIEKHSGIHLNSPWIFTSGGVLSPETAKLTSQIFGFWPVEVYGSTETSGIAWRQSSNGPEWTAFDNAQLSRNEDGCLVIRSPYIKESSGFITADMADMLEDGRFILKGRTDSVVKIEEKRVSLTEMEERILQSGLVSDVSVIAMEDKRQYLAAAVVFNDTGKEKFLNMEKNAVNKFWREYLIKYFENLVIPKKWRYPDAFPLNSQGKKQKEDIKLLFADEKKSSMKNNISPEFMTDGFKSLENEKLIEKNDNSVTLEFIIPGTSPYFTGHFPDFPILPAVAQIELVMRFSARYFGTKISLSQIKRVKFSNLVRPFTAMRLRLENNSNIISFNLSSCDGGISFSSGIVAPL
ncbi:MAG: AMP-binding protein [Treponema sp.]|jgi:uncharacterized membrane protein/acyl-CoA synthetase (AMP-forming)/AMP-acid ligase II/3-hydroxymyristoyl/3-hydroxydecanoyl-(acyl carrier protein) dehydratase|nr:AMP-binding protein [Treponema sp.]